jgi:mRNA interferase RelE/StbE
LSYRLELAHPAKKTLERMDNRTEARIWQRLHELVQSPFDKSKALKGVEGVRSSRVGDWRILYAINEGERLIYVLAVRPRGQAYRRL